MFLYSYDLLGLFIPLKDYFVDQGL